MKSHSAVLVTGLMCGRCVDTVEEASLFSVVEGKNHSTTAKKIALSFTKEPVIEPDGASIRTRFVESWMIGGGSGGFDSTSFRLSQLIHSLL